MIVKWYHHLLMTTRTNYRHQHFIADVITQNGAPILKNYFLHIWRAVASQQLVSKKHEVAMKKVFKLSIFAQKNLRSAKIMGTWQVTGISLKVSRNKMPLCQVSCIWHIPFEMHGPRAKMTHPVLTDLLRFIANM